MYHAILTVDRMRCTLHGASRFRGPPTEPPMFTIATLWIPHHHGCARAGRAQCDAGGSTGPLGTWGATNIRFLSASVLDCILRRRDVATGDHLPSPTRHSGLGCCLGALCQIVATGLMLVAMNDRSFVVTTAYLKTESDPDRDLRFCLPRDHLTVLKVIAILIATVGVIITALRPGGEKIFADLKPTINRLVARRGRSRYRRSAFAAPSSPSRAYRCDGGVLHAGVRAVHPDAGADDLSFGARTGRAQEILGLWRPSMFAGFMGAFASQFWFLAFALTAAANVRTLALVEVLFAASGGVLFVQAAAVGARTFRHRADRGRGGVAGGGVVVIPGRE